MSKIYYHHDKFVVDYLKNNPNLPYLISYPRTGSHWIRYAMEKYFEKPSLVMIYEYVNANEFTCYHTHDLNGTGTGLANTRKDDVIYLYRDPVDTIYSMLRHQMQNQNDEKLIQTHSICYRDHLIKYLLNDDFTKNKVVVKYENFKKDFPSEFKKLCDYLGYDFDKEKIEKIIIGLDKTKIKKESTNKYSNIDDSMGYDISREEFKNKYTNLINSIVFGKDERLKKFF